MTKQLNDFITRRSHVHQSAYKSFHSTETALLKIRNDISSSVDSGKAVALTLLTLHDCLKAWFRVNGTLLTWIDSYLNNRKQKLN